MLFLKLISQLLQVLSTLWLTVTNTMFLTSKLIKRECVLLLFSLQSIFGLTQNQTFTTKLASFLTKKNYFLRDFVFLWRFKDSSDVKSQDRLVSRYSESSGNTIQHGTNSDIHSNIYSTVLSNPFLFKLYNNASTSDFNTYWFKISIINWLRNLINRSFGFGFYYIQGFVFVLFIDACLTDDEPLWEPIEWSLVQTWILFIFSFAWVAENLIVSRYGSYTGRDKRVWMSWYKTFWLIEGYYVINYGVAIVFVIIPFYFETNYNLSFVYSWWHWYSRVFFFKFLSLFSIILLISYYLQMTVRWLNWKKGLFLVLLINIFLSYLIYTQFLITFFGFFTDPVWYQKTRPVDYIQLSHEPARWGWGSAKKDHFTYHNVKTVFWFKNDGPFAAAMIMFQLFLFACVFFLYIYWISLFRRIYAMKEIPLTFTTYCVSSLRQFFYFALFFYLMIFMSYLVNYSRLPAEFLWSIDNVSWTQNFVQILYDYPSFLYSILF
jgi:hypothetical protein